MISDSKLFSKIEHYWLTDDNFRRATWHGSWSCKDCPSNFISYSDLTFSPDDFTNFRDGIYNHSGPLDNQIYNFARRLGVDGMVANLRSITSTNRDRGNISFLSELRKKENNLPELPWGGDVFWRGYKNYPGPQWSLDYTLFYLGGRDLYLEENYVHRKKSK